MNYVTRGLWGHRDHSLQGERRPDTQSGLWVLEEEGKSMCAELAAFAPPGRDRRGSQKDVASQMGLIGAVNLPWAGRKGHHSKGWEL